MLTHALAVPHRPQFNRLPRRLNLLRTLAAAVVAWGCWLPAYAAPAPVILHAQPVHFVNDAPLHQKSARQPGMTLSLQAFGRQFDLTLETNEQLSAALQDSPLRLYRGTLRNQPGSWARLSWRDGQWQGLLWDGEMLYAIEPMAHVAPAGEGDTTGTAMFRLADTLLPATASCSVQTLDSVSAPGMHKGSDAYRSLLDELRHSQPHQAPGATRRLEISVLADAELIALHGSPDQAREAILQRLNYVDGIFSDQLGVEIRPTLIEASNSLPATTSPQDLLKAVGRARSASPTLRASGLTHLFTGRDLDEDIVGKAYVGTLCEPETGAGLTQSQGGVTRLWYEALVAAHEIGHNFGAVHDGEGACSAVPTGQFLMSPDTGGNPEFSSCSLDIMRHKANAAVCIGALPAADVALPASLGRTRAPVGRSFDWQLRVLNAGGLDTTDTRVDIRLTPGVQIEDANVLGGTCTNDGTVASCLLSGIRGSSSHTIELRLRAGRTGEYPIVAEALASNDARPDNNTGVGVLQVTEEADVSLQLNSPPTATTGTTFNLDFIARNHSTLHMDQATLNVALPAGITTASLSLAGSSCQRSSTELRCQLPTLRAGSSLEGQIILGADSARTVQITAELDAQLFDPTPTNNLATQTISVTSTPASMASTTRSGGGGAWGGSWLLLLTGLLYARRRHA